MDDQLIWCKELTWGKHCGVATSEASQSAWSLRSLAGGMLLHLPRQCCDDNGLVTDGRIGWGGRRFKPHRTTYLAFGHDEEVLGTFGAGAMAKLLLAAGVQLEYIFDEGGAVLIDGVRGLTTTPVALVGTAEKVSSLLIAGL